MTTMTWEPHPDDCPCIPCKTLRLSMACTEAARRADAWAHDADRTTRLDAWR